MTLRVRAATVGDLPAIAAFYEGLSTMDRYRRFFSVCPSGPAWDLRRLAEELPHGPVAVVAVAGEAITGLATYGIDREVSEADLGVVVAPPWRRQGIATGMIQHLAGLAAASGVGRLAWTIQADNVAALHLMARLAPATTRSIGSGLVAGSCQPGAITLVA